MGSVSKKNNSADQGLGRLDPGVAEGVGRAGADQNDNRPRGDSWVAAIRSASVPAACLGQHADPIPGNNVCLFTFGQGKLKKIGRAHV